MRQPTIMDLFNKMTILESNKIDELVEDKIISENVIKNITEKDGEQINESNGIVEVRYGDEIYKTWTVKLISPLVTKFLKGIYPYSLIVRGLTDIVVFDNKSDDIIPVEIQKTPIAIGKSKTFSHTAFEKDIRKQLEDNIETYGLCWLFFDIEYLRYLQLGNVSKNINIDMTWLVKLMREEKLKVFTIKYNGNVKELTTKDFDFLKNISQICIINYNGDKRILERNKLKIKKNVLYGYNFTQEEITQFENDFDNRVDNKFRTSESYFANSNNVRCKLYGRVTVSINELLSINIILSCAVDKNPYTTYAVTLGLFHQNDFYGRNNNTRIQFIDTFNVAQYFPGYLRNKEMWDYCKNEKRIFTINEFRRIIEGREHCLKLIKQQSKSLADYD